MQDEVQKKVKRLLAKEKKHFKESMGRVFPDESGESKRMNSIRRRMESLKLRQKDGLSLILEESLGSISMHALYRQLFYRGYHSDNDTASTYFCLSSFAGYHNAVSYSEYFTHYNARLRITHRTGGLYLAQCMLCSWWDRAETLTKLYAESVSMPKPYKVVDTYTIEGIIRDGAFFDLGAWFVMDLCCLYFGVDYDKQYADTPRTGDYDIYREVLDNWQTQDVERVNIMLYKLCELHITRPTKDESGFSYEFEGKELFPYEVMAWLQLREKAGLENPEKYTHPLMNTVYSQFYTPADTPLPIPAGDNSVSEILQHVHQLLPDLELEDI